MRRFSQMLAVLCIVSALGAPAVSFAQNPNVSQIQQTIEQRNEEIKKLEQEIKQYEEVIDTTVQQKATLQTEIVKIDTTRKKLSTDIQVTSKKIDNTSATITQLAGSIADKQTRINNHQKALGQSIKKLYELDEMTMFEMLLSKKEVSSFWESVDDLQRFEKGVKERIDELRGLHQVLAEDKAETEEEKNKLLSLKTDIEDQKKLVDETKKVKDTLLKVTQNKESLYRQEVAAREAKIQAFEAEIRQYEEALKFDGDETKLPNRGSAPLSWPVDEVVVTALFGSKTGPHRTRANGHSGTDFRARTPVKVYAMADGVVMGVGDTDKACRGVSFGKWITIKYDNNLVSTFAHLSLINVANGQRVTRGQVVGYTGNTGFSTAPHLHVSVYAGVDANGNNPVDVSPKPSITCKGAILTQPTAPSSAYLDPLDYLPKPLTAAMFKNAADFAQY